jgi:hypothetical protein
LVASSLAERRHVVHQIRAMKQKPIHPHEAFELARSTIDQMADKVEALLSWIESHDGLLPELKAYCKTAVYREYSMIDKADYDSLLQTLRGSYLDIERNRNE